MHAMTATRCCSSRRSRSRETRRFVQHVLAYTWIYAARLELPAPSLEELAAGAFPRFYANSKLAAEKAGYGRLN